MKREENMNEPGPLSSLVLEPTYTDVDGTVRKPTPVENAVQSMLEKNAESVRRYIDPDSQLDVETIDSFTPDGLFHVPIERYSLPNGNLSHIRVSGAGIMGRVTNDFISMESDGQVRELSPNVSLRIASDGLAELSDEKRITIQTYGSAQRKKLAKSILGLTKRQP